MPAQRRLRLVVDIPDPELLQAVKIAAVECDQPVKNIVIDALRRWLQAYENERDIAATREVAHEERVPWEQVKAGLEQARAAERAR